MSAMSSDVTATGGADDDFTEESYGDND